MANRYCYIVRSREIDIAHVYTGYTEACDEAHRFAMQQGAGDTVTQKVNDELTRMIILKPQVPMEVWIERHRLK